MALSPSVGDQRLGRVFARLALLNILANLTVPLAGLVDLAMLGHLEEIRYLAGVALGGIVFDYLYWTFGVLRMGTTGLVAQAAGRDDHTEGMRVLARAALVGAGCGLVILALRLPIGDLAFALLSGSNNVEAAGRSYFDARVLGAPAALTNLAFLGWYLGRGESRIALVMTVVGNLANIALNYLLIIRLDLAAGGAGLATAASQYLTLAVAVGYLLPRRQSTGGWHAILDRDRIADTLRLSGDIFLRTLLLTSAFALFTNLSALFGTVTLAANAILLRVVQTAAYLVDGAAYATESLAGFAHGRRQSDQLARLLRLAIATGIAFEAAVALIVVAAPATLFGLLTSHQAVIESAAEDRWWLLPVMIPGALAYIYDGFFLGLTAGRVLRNAMFLSFAAFIVPALFAAAVGSNDGLWLALAAFMAARAWLLYRQTGPFLVTAAAQPAVTCTSMPSGSSK